MLYRRLEVGSIVSNSYVSADGSGEVSEESRQLKEGEMAEWVLLDGVGFLCYRGRK